MKKRVLELLVALAVALCLVAAGCEAVPEPETIVETMMVEQTKVVVVEGEEVIIVETVEVEVVATAAAAPTPTPTLPPLPAGNVLTFGVWGDMPASRFCTLPAADDSTGLEEFWLYGLSTATLSTLDENLEWTWDLAQRVEVSDDGLVAVFYLRDDVTWHDGQRFTADDVAFTFGLILDSGIGDYHQVFSDIVSSVAVIDEFTVEFVLEHPINTGDLSAASAWRSLLEGWTPVPAHCLAGTPAAEVCDSTWAQNNPQNSDQCGYVGLGPLQVVGFDPSGYVSYEPYDDYYGYQDRSSPSPLDGIEIYFSQDPAWLFAALEAGSMAMVQTSPEFVPQVDQNPDLEIPDNTALIAVNLAAWPPGDAFVHRALLQPPGETFVPYRKSLSELGGIIGQATLLPQHPETEAAIQQLEEYNLLDGVRINKARTVSLAGNPQVAHLAPFGPESAPADAADLWFRVQDNGGRYVIGTFVVVEQNPHSVQAYAVRVEGDQDNPEVHFVPADGSPPIVVSGDDVDVVEPDEPGESVEIPIAGMRSGSRTCWVRWDWIEFSYTCWW